jgi:hypothetical protein
VAPFHGQLIGGRNGRQEKGREEKSQQEIPKALRIQYTLRSARKHACFFTRATSVPSIGRKENIVLDSRRMNDGKNTSAAADPGPRGNDGTASPATVSATTEGVEVNRKFYEVDFRVHVSMRYHQARRAWWTGLNRISSIAAALAGSAAVITVFGAHGASYWAFVAAVSGGFAALNAALGFTDRAREHATLYDKFSGIAAKMASEGAPDDAIARRYESEVLQLEASEPPSIHTLNVICHNQECQARGHGPDDQYRIFLINRIFKSWFTGVDKFPKSQT